MPRPRAPRRARATRVRGALSVSALLLLFPLAGCDRPAELGEAGTVLRDALGSSPVSDAFERTAAEVLPTVVYVQVEGRPRPTGPSMFPMLQQRPDAPIQPIGSGSGVIFSPEGYILTNNHVVREAERVQVTLYDRRQLEARVVARDPSTDIAVLQVEGEEFPAAPLGDSDELNRGQWVMALGSPLGLQFTVTTGIVSAIGRSIGILGPSRQQPAREEGVTVAAIEDFIQTDAAINPGNSGGPLVNLAGEVVGINTAIASPTGVYAGYGFAVPINLARRVAEQLIRFGEVRRPYLGVSLDEVDQVDARVYGLDRPRGAELKLVEAGSPAARAGLVLGDVIVGVGGVAVNSVPELQAALAQLDAGSRTTVQVVRYGETRELPIALGVTRSGVRPRPRRAEPDDPLNVGFQVAQRGDDVVIARVSPFSAAGRAGLRPGLEIVAVNRDPITSTEDLVRRLRAVNDTPLSFVLREPQSGVETIVNFVPQ